MTTRYPRRSTYPHSASQSAEAVGTGSRAPVGTATPAATSSAASATSEAAGPATPTKPPFPSPTLTSTPASPARPTIRNGSGRESSDQAPSSERAIKAPNNTPTSGLVTKSRPARPAPPPRAKNPPGSSYRAASTKRSNGIGPSRRMRSAMRSASASVPVLGMEKHAMRPIACRGWERRRTAREGHLADPGEQLGVDADHDDNGGGQAERDAQRGRRPHRHGLDAGLGRVTEPHAARDP